jgi:hypothetical protein
MRRPFVVLIAIAAVGAIAAPSASAGPGCSTPSELTWHSCLTAGHRAVLHTDNVRLTRATAVLVVRMSACPADVPSRRVVIRTDKRKRVARERVEGTCKHNVARWRLRVKPEEFDVRAGTVIHSYWSGIDDGDDAPSVKLGKKKS